MKPKAEISLKFFKAFIGLLALFFCNNVFAENVIHRYAIVVGANNGGPTRTPLRYAVSDAGSFMNVLTEMGGLPSDNGLLLFDPDKRNFFGAFGKMRKMIARARTVGKRIEFFFYYSGHSDEEGILLGAEKLTYKEIKENITVMPADFRISILDSCASGAFTMIKGGKKKPPFYMDISHNMKGNAILTSSSFDEMSQESDKIKGSFFTHYLVTGLRGAADITQDSRITLNEAYQYAYNETLLRTSKTLSGPQHPNYNIQMTGIGDVILTDIRKSSSKLEISKALSGKFLIHDRENILVSEFYKAYGRNLSFGLESGAYTVINQSEKGIYEARVNVPKGGILYLSAKNFHLQSPELTYARGEEKVKAEKNKADGQTQAVKKNFLIDRINYSPSSLSGYGAPVLAFSRIGRSFGLMTGVQGGFIIDEKFVIGGLAYGLAYPQKREEVSGLTYIGEYPNQQFGYGGLHLEYYFSPSSLVHFSLGLLTGGGGLSFQNPTDEMMRKKGDSFFAMEPELNLFVNITWFCRVSIGLSYRYINGLSGAELSDRDFSGMNFTMKFAFGRF